MVRLTDRPDMTLDVYRGRKRTIQQQQQQLIWMFVGQEPIALAVDAGWFCLDSFTLLYIFSPLSPSLWETARYNTEILSHRAVMRGLL